MDGTVLGHQNDGGQIGRQGFQEPAKRFDTSGRSANGDNIASMVANPRLAGRNMKRVCHP